MMLLRNIPKISIIVIMLFSIMAHAAVVDETVSDSTGDVYYQPGGGNDIQTGLSTQPNIDISSVSNEIQDNNLKISINVVGEITESPQILYYGECQSSDAIYQFTYKNQSLVVFVETDAGKLPVESIAIVNGNILEVLIPLQTQDTTISDLYAYAHYYEDPVELMMGPKYIDTTEDNTDDLGSTPATPTSATPGFEIFLLIIATLVIVGLINKRKT